MIWIQENKGLATFLGFCLVVAAALGFMALGSYTSYSEAYTNFAAARTSVETLEKKPLYPDQESVDLKQAAVEAYEKVVSAFREGLVKFQEPLDNVMTGNEFQTQLANRVGAVQKLAERKGVTLPEEFRLDFDKWINSPAPQEAVAKLDFQLEAITNLVTTAIESGITDVDLVERGKLQEEGGQPATPAVKRPPTRGGSAAGTPAPAAPVGEVLVERYPVEIVITTPHDGLVNFLNALSNASKTPNHFFIVRLLEVQNEQQQGPSKDAIFEPEPIYPDVPDGGVLPLDPGLPVDPAVVPLDDPAAVPLGDPAFTPPVDPGFPIAPTPFAPGPSFGAGQPIANRDTKILLGNEKLKVYLKVEVIRFKPEEKEGDEEASGGSAS